MKERIYIFDFDGTIVDVWKRFYRVFNEFSCGVTVSFSEYCKVKKRLGTDKLVFSHFGLGVPEHYPEIKKQLLESPDYLKEDTLLIPAGQLLKWFGDHQSIILTSRRCEKNFFWQLNELGLSTLSDRAFVVSPDVMTKKQWLTNRMIAGCEYTVFGDSLIDMQMGELDSVTAVFVDSGLKCLPMKGLQCPIRNSYCNIQEALRDL